MEGVICGLSGSKYGSKLQKINFVCLQYASPVVLRPPLQSDVRMIHCLDALFPTFLDAAAFKPAPAPLEGSHAAALGLQLAVPEHGRRAASNIDGIIATASALRHN